MYGERGVSNKLLKREQHGTALHGTVIYKVLLWQVPRGVAYERNMKRLHTHIELHP